MKKINNDSEEKSNINKSIDKSFILYIITFIPYLFLVYSAIFGITINIFLSSTTSYGFEGLFIALILGCIIPVYPIIFIFQIIYTFIKYKKFTNEQKKFIKYFIATLLILLLVPPTVMYTKEKYDINKAYTSDSKIIENYLQENFNEKIYNEMQILKLDNSNDLTYTVTTPLLDYAFTVELNSDRNLVVKDTFTNEFSKQNNFQNKFSEYMSKSISLPNNIKLNCIIENIDMKNYDEKNSIESIFDKCTYSIESIDVTVDNYNKNEVTTLIKDFYSKYNEYFEQNLTHTFLNFYIKLNNKYYASVNTFTSQQNNSITCIFSGYNYGNGYTIENSTESIELID